MHKRGIIDTLLQILMIRTKILTKYIVYINFIIVIDIMIF